MNLSRTYVFPREIFLPQQCTGRDCTGRHQDRLLAYDPRFVHGGRVSHLAEPRYHEANSREHEYGAYSEQDIA